MGLASGNQTGQWTIQHLQMLFPLKLNKTFHLYPFLGDFPASHVEIAGGERSPNFQLQNLPRSFLRVQFLFKPQGG